MSDCGFVLPLFDVSLSLSLGFSCSLTTRTHYALMYITSEWLNFIPLNFRSKQPYEPRYRAIITTATLNKFTTDRKRENETCNQRIIWQKVDKRMKVENEYLRLKLYEKILK